MKIDVAIIGGGSAGMSAALSAYKNGVSVVIFEREARLGGILKQCIHNGFGLKYFKKEMTGPEYAHELIKQVEKTNIKVLLESSVTEIQKNADRTYTLSFISPNGKGEVTAKAIVLAMGCRERPGAAISLCGTRPVGVITAGCAQKIINIDGKMIGKKVVIVGSGDVGLIMARRLYCEGAEVLGVYEISQTPSGLNRNIVQCLNDYNIPLHLGETVMEVVGKNRVEGVVVAKVNPDYSFNLKTRKLIKCDTVLLSVGLVPENDLVYNQIVLDGRTSGAVVDDSLMTSSKGIFSCGNVLHVHDIVDDVTFEAELAGKFAALYCKNQAPQGKTFDVCAGQGVRYVVPEKVTEGQGFVPFKFRVTNRYPNAKLVVKCNGETIASRNCNVLLPAQMEQIMVDKSKISGQVVVEVLS